MGTTLIERANEEARKEGGIFRVEPNGSGQAAIVWASGPDEGRAYWHGSTRDAKTQVRIASIDVKVKRAEDAGELPEMPSY